MRTVVAIFFLPILAIAQGSMPLASSNAKTFSYLTSFYSAEGINSSIPAEEIGSFIDKLAFKKATFKSEKSFLGHIFTKTHQRFLKHYQESATFHKMLEKGTYNCLTGTALYALILEDLGFQYEIIETNYHIFLLAETADGRILFESTDPLQGFVSGDAEIQKRIAVYRQNIPVMASNRDKTYYRFNVDLFNSIHLDEILGLLYYNLAIEAYNKKDIQSSINNLEKAVQLYQSPRTEEFSKIILLTIMESKIENSLKENLLRKIQVMRNVKMPVVASAKSL